jgi:hypothetical protein
LDEDLFLPEAKSMTSEGGVLSMQDISFFIFLFLSFFLSTLGAGTTGARAADLQTSC